MSILTFRNAYLAKLNARLNAVDVANAKDTDLLIYGAMLKHLDNVTKLDAITLDGLRMIETMSAADLDEYALDPSSRGLVIAILQNTATMQTILQHTGIMTAMAGSVQWLKLLEQNANLANVCASVVAMNAIASSAAGRSVFMAPGSTLASTARSNSLMACAKVLAGNAGLNPADYATLDDIKNSNTAAAKMVEIPANQSFIGTSGNLFDVLKQSNVFCGKLLAAALSLNLASFADMTAFAANGSAVTALAANSGALAIAATMPIALTELFGNYTARSLLWASELARQTFYTSPAAYAYLQSIVSNVDYGIGSFTGTKKVWSIKISALANQTGGYVDYYSISGGGSANNSNNRLSVPLANDGVIGYAIAKAHRIDITNATTGNSGNTIRYTYIQMEA